MNEELTPQRMDQFLFNEPKDERKPMRRFIDDTVMPNVGMVAAPPMMALQALSQMQRTPRLINVA